MGKGKLEDSMRQKRDDLIIWAIEQVADIPNLSMDDELLIADLMAIYEVYGLDKFETVVNKVCETIEKLATSSLPYDTLKGDLSEYHSYHLVTGFPLERTPEELAERVNYKPAKLARVEQSDKEDMRIIFTFEDDNIIEVVIISHRLQPEDPYKKLKKRLYGEDYINPKQ